MRVIIFQKNAGNKPTIYSREPNLKTAKKILADKYLSAITDQYEEVVDGRDYLSKSGKELQLFNTLYFIEQDKTL